MLKEELERSVSENKYIDNIRNKLSKDNKVLLDELDDIKKKYHEINVLRKKDQRVINDFIF